jgi:hypothetical protein
MLSMIVIMIKELQVVRCDKRITAALLRVGTSVVLGLSVFQDVQFPKVGSCRDTLSFSVLILR